MDKSVKLKLAVGMVLSFVFMFFDLFVNASGTILHFGPFIVACIFVSVITTLQKK